MRLALVAGAFAALIASASSASEEPILVDPAGPYIHRG